MSMNKILFEMRENVAMRTNKNFNHCIRNEIC